jgi:hypothetical protein
MAQQTRKPGTNTNANRNAATNANDLDKPNKLQNLDYHTDLNQPPTDDVERDEELLDEAADAVEAMETREHRRDSTHRTSGDDHSPGIDTDIDSNAPKENEQQGSGRHQQGR